MSGSRTRAHDFFELHVAPSIAAWQKHPGDIHLAMSAAVQLNQMADYFWHAYASSDAGRVFGATSAGTFRKELAARNPEFGLVSDVAEAHKHMKLNKPVRAVTSAGQAFVEPVFTQAKHAVKKQTVVVKRDDGTKQDLGLTMNQVVQLWKSMLG